MASSPTDAASADDALVLEVEEKLRRLNLRLTDLEGKANKKERTAVGKEIYALQNDGKYVAAKKEQLSGARAAAAAADDAAHAAKIAAEAAATAAREERTRLDRRWQDASERELWYEGGSKYWEQQTVGDNNGVLGGFADVHVQDTRDSLKFARKLPLRPRGEADADGGGGGGGGDRPTRALDVAAGIGRVSGATLLTLCDRVDVQDGCGPFIDQARKDLAWAGPRVERFITETMQEFHPEGGRYDLVWIQWCIGSLTDDDLVEFLKRIRASLADGGVIVIKDNVVDTKDFDPGELEAGAYLVDYDDNSVIRKRPLLRAIFERCALKVIADAPSRLGRDDLHPVHAFALVPA